MSRSTAILAAVLAACTLPAPEAEDTASASVALSDVPLDVQCLQILVAAGGRSFAPLFDVSPGASASLTVAALPPGPPRSRRGRTRGPAPGGPRRPRPPGSPMPSP